MDGLALALTMIDWQAAGDEAVGYFKDLLRFETVNPPGNERPAAEYLAWILAQEGIEAQLIEREPGRTNLVARLKGSGARGPLLLNGHLDVVPVEREQWLYDPFGAEEAEGCIWGRGAIDMKNMVTMSLMAMLLLKRSGARLERDLIFAAVADEEAGSTQGALHLVEQHPELVRSEYVLNEVGGYTLHTGAARVYPVQVSEKGICWFELVAEGEPGHGSMPHPNNAVVKLARALSTLGQKRLPLHVTPVVEQFLRALASRSPSPQRQAMPLLLQPRFADHLLRVIERQDPARATGLNAMLRNTVSPTVVAAGRKVNVIPSQARAQVDGRVIPGQSVEDFLREVQRLIGNELKINVLTQHDGTVFPSTTPLYEAICRSVERHDPGSVAVPYMIPGFTDSFAYGKLGAVCYGFSPTRLGPDLNFARMYHGHNERIPVDGFRWGLRVLFEVVRDFVTGASS
jgi:acetylornithine deacetylase/succinyl-diaminopimelate desuccinylase-like protein